MAMVKVVMCACFGFAAMTLQGCGSGGTTTAAPGNATTAAPTTAAPAITTSPYTYPNIKDGTLTLTWAAAGTDKLKVTLASTSTGSLTPAWLAVGFTPDGKMGAGNYVMGYENCVRSMSNVAKGSIPANSSKLPVTDASFQMTGKAMTLTFAVSTGAWMAAGGNYVLTAAGSTAAKPKDCATALTSANQHDMHNFVTTGSKFVLKPAQQLQVV